MGLRCEAVTSVRSGGVKRGSRRRVDDLRAPITNRVRSSASHMTIIPSCSEAVSVVSWAEATVDLCLYTSLDTVAAEVGTTTAHQWRLHTISIGIM